jgi:hypothetical protein
VLLAQLPLVELPADVELSLCTDQARFLPILHRIVVAQEGRGRGAFALTPLSTLWDLRHVPFSTTVVKDLVARGCGAAARQILRASTLGGLLANSDNHTYRAEPAHSFRHADLASKVRLTPCSLSILLLIRSAGAFGDGDTVDGVRGTAARRWSRH